MIKKTWQIMEQAPAGMIVLSAPVYELVEKLPANVQGKISCPNTPIQDC